MKGKQVFALGMIVLAVSQVVHAEVDTVPGVSLTSTTVDDRFNSKCAGEMNIAFVTRTAR